MSSLFTWYWCFGAGMYLGKWKYDTNKTMLEYLTDAVFYIAFWGYFAYKGMTYIYKTEGFSRQFKADGLYLLVALVMLLITIKGV